jgi:hypothetical protein
MLSISALIAFLLDLLRSDEARAEFERDPEGALADAGLSGVSAQDVRDATAILGSGSGIRFRDDDSHTATRSVSDDPVQEIRHVTNSYQADDHATIENSFTAYDEYHFSYTDNSTNAVNIDDRDALIVGEEVNVEDSFNGDSSANVAQGSFNSDDDTLVNDSFNETTTDITAIDDSTFVEDSFNDTDVVAIDEGSGNTVVQDSALGDDAESSDSAADSDADTPADTLVDTTVSA